MKTIKKEIYIKKLLKYKIIPYRIRFVTSNSTHLWSNKEGEEKTTIYVVAWDQSDNKTTGIHQFSFPVSQNASISSRIASTYTGRLGCDGKQGSRGRVDVCGKCGGDGKSCRGCDGGLNSGAVLGRCTIRYVMLLGSEV